MKPWLNVNYIGHTSLGPMWTMVEMHTASRKNLGWAKVDFGFGCDNVMRNSSIFI